MTIRYPLITRQEIVAMLLDWQAGRLREEQVHDWAEAHFWPGENYYDDIEADGASAANEVLAKLDMMNINLTTKADIPIFLEFLATPHGQFNEAYRAMEETLRRIDITARQRELAHISFYATFC